MISFNLLSQRYNMDYSFSSNILSNKVWVIDAKVIEGQIIFNWEKDIVTWITIQSIDSDFFFPKIDAYMTSQLVLNSLSKGSYKVQFLDDCNAIMDIKEFEIK